MARKKTVEQALARLEQIVAELEQGDLALDAGLKKFNEGIQLASFCGQKLDETRSQVDLLLKKADGSLAAEPFCSAHQEPLRTARPGSSARSLFQGNDHDGSRTQPA